MLFAEFRPCTLLNLVLNRHRPTCSDKIEEITHEVEGARRAIGKSRNTLFSSSRYCPFSLNVCTVDPDKILVQELGASEGIIMRVSCQSISNEAESLRPWAIQRGTMTRHQSSP